MEIGLETSSRRLSHTRGHGREDIVTTSEKKKLGWVSNRSLHLSFTVVCFLWLLNFATAHVSATSTIRPWPSHEFFANVINKTVGQEMVNETESSLPLKSLKPDILETVLKFKENGTTRTKTAITNLSTDVDDGTLRSNATATPPGSATIAVRLLDPEASLASAVESATLPSSNPSFIKQTVDNDSYTKPTLGGATITDTELQAREDTAENSPTSRGKFPHVNISLGNKDTLTRLNFPTVDGASNATFKPVALTKPETREQLQRDQADTRVNHRTGQAREWVPLLPKSTLSNSHQSRHEAYPSQVSTGETVPFRVFRSKIHQAKFPPGLGLYTSLDLNRNENFETSTKEYVDDDKFGWWGPEEELEGSNSFPTRPPVLMRLTWPYTKTWTGTKRPTPEKTEHPVFVGSNPVKATPTARPATQYPVIVPQRLTSSNPVTSTPPTTMSTADQPTRFYKVPIIIVTPTPRPNYVTIVSSNKISSHHWGSHGASTGTWLIPGSGGQLQAPLTGAVPSEEDASKFSTKMMELVTNPPRKYSQLPASKNTGTALEFAVEDKNERGGEAPELMGFKNPTNIWYKPVINHHYGSREDGSSVKKNEKFNNTVITLANALPHDMTLLPFQQQEYQSQTSHTLPEPAKAPSTSLLGNTPGSESGYFGSENSSSSHHHSHSSTVLLGSSATKQDGEKILFRVWNLVNGSLELDSETGIPRWLLKDVDINKDHVLNLNELPRPIQSLVEESSFLASQSPPIVKTPGNGSESTLLEKRLGFQGQWEPLASKKNILLGSFKSPDSQSPSPNHPVLNYVLWPPGKSLLQDSKFHHRPSETSLFDHLFSEETESGNWNRIKDYLKRQQFANSYPAYLPLEPNPGQFPQFHDKDVSNLLALSLILSYLNRNGVDGEAKPGYLTSMFPTPPHKQSHYSSSPGSALHSIQHTLDQLLPEQPTRFGNHQENSASPSFTSSSQYSSNSHHQQPPRPNPSRSPSPPPSPNPMDSFSKTPTPPAYQDYQDEEEDNKDDDNRFGETNNFPVSIKDRTKTLLTKFIKKKFKKKLKKKLKKKKKGLSAFDFNFDIGIDLVDLVKNKLLTLLTLKYAPLAVLALTTLAPTVLIYIPLLLKVFHKFKHHDDDDHHHNPPVHHFVYPYTHSYPVHPPSHGHDGPPPKGHDQGWGWGDHPGYSGVGPRQHHHHRGHHSPSFTHSAPSQIHAPPGPSGGGVENVPGPPYYPPGIHGHPSPDSEEGGGKRPPPFVRGPHKQMQGPGPPPTGPFQFTENDADGYMNKIRDIGRNLGKLIGNQINDPVNQQAMQIIVDSKKDAFSSLLSKLLDFKPMDYRPKFKDSDEEWPQNGRKHSFRKRRKRMLYKY